MIKATCIRSPAVNVSGASTHSGRSGESFSANARDEVEDRWLGMKVKQGPPKIGREQGRIDHIPTLL